MNQKISRLNQKIERELGPDVLSFLEDESVCEIMLNEDGNLWVEKFGSGMKVEGSMSSLQAKSLILTLASCFETTLTQKTPILECELPIDGSRFEGIIPPVVSAPIFTIRKMASVVFTLDDYVESGVLSVDYKENIEEAVFCRKNILIAGGTGSGKTTFANAVLQTISNTNPEHRLVVMEDTKEIQCECSNYVAMQTTDTRNMTDLLRASMRMRPDRIIVGEVRGGEALSMLKAWNTGHPGGVATVHANSAFDALSRIEQLVGEATLTPSQSLIADAIDLIVFIKKNKRGRQVDQILEVEGYKNSYKTKKIGSFRRSGQNKLCNNGLYVIAGGMC